MNDFDITDIEKQFTDEVRKLGFSHVWNNRPKATSDDISDFVVVRVSGGVNDRLAYGDCHVIVQLFVRDVKEMKNSKKLSVMQKKLLTIPLSTAKLFIDGQPRIIGDTADDFGFHARIVNFKVIIKSV